MRVSPAGCVTNVLVKASSDKIKIFDALVGGNEITIDGTKNKFPIASLPKDLFIAGDKASDAMRDVEISVDVEGGPAHDDFVKITVLWLDKPVVAQSGTVSADNAKRDNYKNWTKAGNYDLKLQNYNATLGERKAWGTEARAVVHPSGFNYPGNDLKLERDMHIKYYTDAATTYDIAFSASIPPGNDTGPAAARDDDPAPNDTIYDFDAPGAFIADGPLNSLIRIRYNFKSFASITVEGTPVRCSEVTPYFVRFSQKQRHAPHGTDWRVITPPDVAGDNQAAGGSTNVTRNLL